MKSGVEKAGLKPLKLVGFSLAPKIPDFSDSESYTFCRKKGAF